MKSPLGAISVVAVAWVAAVSPGVAQQPDSCGRQELPCCPGFDAVGERCQVDCTFTICTVPGFDAFCEEPVEGDPDIGDAPTICRGCGQLGLKCCDDTAVGEAGSCGSRSGLGVCTDTDEGPLCLPFPLVPIWQQCGGEGFDGGRVCEEGLTCEYVNRWYSQCEPSEAEGVLLWQQCGGQGYEGPTDCQAGATCVEINEFYSQCEP